MCLDHSFPCSLLHVGWLVSCSWCMPSFFVGNWKVNSVDIQNTFLWYLHYNPSVFALWKEYQFTCRVLQAVDTTLLCLVVAESEGEMLLLFSKWTFSVILLKHWNGTHWWRLTFCVEVVSFVMQRRIHMGLKYVLYMRIYVMCFNFFLRVTYYFLKAQYR